MQPQREIILGLPAQSRDFGGKRCRELVMDRSKSLESFFFLFAGTYEIIKKKRRKKKYEEWDAKGGFNMCIPAGLK